MKWQEKFILYVYQVFDVSQLVFPERGQDQRWKADDINLMLDMVQVDGKSYPIISE